jgi:hypothetical protein
MRPRAHIGFSTRRDGSAYLLRMDALVVTNVRHERRQLRGQ